MLEKFIRSRNIEESTIKGYNMSISQYESFCRMKIDELIKEAWDDEEKYRNIHKRKIYDRILDFRTALLETERYEISTINNMIIKLQAIYTHYGVKFPQIRPLKNKKEQLSYFDLPNKNHIRMALDATGVQNQAIILFLASSGMGKSECASITIGDFMDATSEYHGGGDLGEIIDELCATDEPLVPTFSLTRRKTQKQYYAFCTPEASLAILKYLKHRMEVLVLKNKRSGGNDELDLSLPLFGTNSRGINSRLAIINDKLEFGFKGKFRFFLPYTLRKFFASNIGLGEEYIDILQGRKRSSIHDAYIKPNPKYLKEIYMNAMDNVTINSEKEPSAVSDGYNIHIHLHFHEI